jgi:hypothetical protein
MHRPSGRIRRPLHAVDQSAEGGWSQVISLQRSGILDATTAHAWWWGHLATKSGFASESVTEMSTAEEYRAKAAEYAKNRDDSVSEDEASVFRRLAQSYKSLADNEEWLAHNAGNIEHSPTCDSMAGE